MRPVVLMLAVAVFCLSCGEENASPEGCTESYCPFVGVWRLDALFADDDAVNDDLSDYRLNLQEPQPGSQSGNYQRTFSSGETETGSWTVTNNGDVVVLDTPDGTESYLVESVGEAALILVIDREGEKPGPAQFRFVFER